ncbi:hypothetical protein [Streptomyces sp. BA2]|uniref:hypothetical protein n=1 Tax=Streptomyces sp. BA2 TaxID=436595 RepID=UPI0013282993|nr:hypothetical protein [Streptomyces sp. BA2]MWA12809.1 hypothetical protein [Streptomyces sp. BA2]
MLDSTMTALAAAAGLAVAGAAGTDAWSGIRQAVARWFGRGDEERERAELARLDQTAVALTGPGGDAALRARIDEEASWRTRFEMLLESLDEARRREAVAQLQALVEGHGTAPGLGRISVAGPGATSVVGSYESHGATFNINEVHGGLWQGGPAGPTPPAPPQG